jgi:Ca2+-binding EF-hand superfamily protein
LRFSNNWVSVRKAFLDLDYDHDGFITGEDIMRYLGASNREIDLNDLMKLMREKDSNKLGKLSYADFSKWMGVVIH